MATLVTCVLSSSSSPGAEESGVSVRRMKCELGVVSRADGSARMFHGDTAGRMRKG